MGAPICTGFTLRDTKSFLLGIISERQKIQVPQQLTEKIISKSLSSESDLKEYQSVHQYKQE